MQNDSSLFAPKKIYPPILNLFAVIFRHISRNGQKMKNPNSETIENIVREHQDVLFRFAFFRTGSIADAQDIVQNVFIRLFEHPQRLPKIENVKSYLFRSVSNGCNDFLRRNKNHIQEPIERAMRRPAHEQEELYAEEYRRIEGIMSHIPPEQAEVIRLKTIAEMTFPEIAEMLETPLATVKSRFRYGIEKIRSKIN